MTDLKYIVAQATGIPALFNSLNRNRLLVIAYHGIYDGQRNDEMFPNTFVHVDEMVRQLKHMKSKYQIIHPDELLASLETESPLPDHSVLVTFDDGYESFFRIATPILQSLGINPLVFISTEYVEQHKPFWFDLVWFFVLKAPQEKLFEFANNLGIEASTDKNRLSLAVTCLDKIKRMLPDQRNDITTAITSVISTIPDTDSNILSLFYPITHEQIKELSNHGTMFGGHTHTHTILSALPENRAKTEIFESKRKLEYLIGMPCYFFAYPNGARGDFSELHKNMLESAGYKAAFSLTQERTLVDNNKMDIGRVHVAPEDTLRSLSFRCTGITPFIKYLKAFFPSKNRDRFTK